MVSHKGTRWSQLGSAVAIMALAASSCGGESTVTSNQPANSDPSASCAQNPSAPNCAAPANGNASTILVMIQPVGGKPGSAAAPPPVTTTAPPTAPVTTPPRLPIGGTPGSGIPGTGVPGMSVPGAGTPTTPVTGTPAPGAAGAAAPGAAGGAAPSAAGAAAPGMNLAGISAEEMDKLRQACVDEINMYRATLTANMLKPMKRASAAQEDCSDRGAQMDGDSMQAHGAAKAGLCQSLGLFSEDTCPGYPVGGFGGASTLLDALKGCLKQMWAEGEPPVSRAECQKDYQNCFLKYGHYLNMSDPMNLVASCGFYKMKSGAYWMNQDFGYR